MRICRYFFLMLAWIGLILNANIKIQFHVPITALAFSKDGRYLVVGFYNSKVSVINVERGIVESTTSCHQAPVASIAKDEELITIGYSNGTMVIKKWDDLAWATLDAHRDKINALQYIGSVIVSGSEDKTFCVWNRQGLLLKKIQLPAPISAIEGQYNSKAFYVGCKDGSVFRYDMQTELVEQLVDNLKKGPITCIKSAEHGFFAGFGNCEVVFFNEIDKSTKIFGSSTQIEALEYIDHDRLLVGASKDFDADCIWDYESCVLFESLKDHDKINGPVAINRLNVASALGPELEVRAIRYQIKDLTVVMAIDEAKFDKLTIVDPDAHVSGHLKLIGKSRDVHKMRLCLRLSSFKRGGYIDLRDQAWSKTTWYYFHPLSEIKQLIFFRGIPQGDVVVGYSVDSAPQIYNHTSSPSTRSAMLFFPSPIHAVLYSVTLAITQAWLTSTNTRGEKKWVQGLNLNGGRAIWRFEDANSSGPYTLSLKSGDSVYEWEIPYLSTQSELIVGSDSHGRPSISHVIEFGQQCHQLQLTHSSIVPISHV